jgi:phytanoyl-CoA hydroxylase
MAAPLRDQSGPLFHRDCARTLAPSWSCALDGVEEAVVYDARDPELPAIFSRDGFVVVEGALSEAEVREILANVERYRRFIAPHLPLQDWVRRGPDDAISNMYFLKRVDPYFEALGDRPELLDLACRIVNLGLSYDDAETFDKPPGSGPAAVPHQDGIYFESTSERLAHLWIPFDLADAGNGAMLYWPGSHRRGLVEHYRLAGDPDLGGIPDELVAELGPPTIAVVKPGQLIVHGDRVVHASNPNLSSASRRAIALCYSVA